MTLLEALVALVILGLSVVGYLEVFQGAGRSIRAAEEWNRATAVAESVVESAVVAHREAVAPEAIPLPDGFAAQVDSRAWRVDRVDDVSVTVTLPDGRALTVHRLVRVSGR